MGNLTSVAFENIYLLIQLLINLNLITQHSAFCMDTSEWPGKK